MPDIDAAFILRSRQYLANEYMTKISRCLDVLSDDDVWWRPNASSNSVGNLVLHLAGNVRQWIVSGVGGGPDTRRRQEEFDRRDPLAKSELRALIASAVEDADRVLASLNPGELRQRRKIQGYDVTVFEAVYHVVEHFSMHVGQIVYVTKLRSGADMGFYKVNEGGEAKPNW